MNLLREKLRLRPMGAAAYFGGDSNSETKNSTDQRDMRVVGGDASSNVSANDSTVNVMQTDYGAVSGGLNLGGQAIDASVKLAQGSNATALSLFNGAVSAVNKSSEQVAGAYSKVASDLATAFTDSKAPDKNILVIGGFVAVGLAAVMFWGKK